jgi:exodeoxyribonuclease-1
LYNGFFSDADRATMKIILQTKPQNLPALDLTFQDPRLETLFFRFRARNYPNILTDSEQQRWLEHRREALNPERVREYVLQLEQFYNQYENDKKKLALLKALFDYARDLVS